MAQAHFRRLVLATLTLLATTGPAQSQTQSFPDISGRWLFKTVLLDKGCTISGDIDFHKGMKPYDYLCTLHAREDCARIPTPTFTEVKQSCVAQIDHGEINIVSKIEAITDAGPADFKAYMQANLAYSPDNFRVHPKSGELVGMFSSLHQAPVRFWRDKDLVS